MFSEIASDLMAVVKAQKEYDKAEANYMGDSWGYDSFDLTQALNRATEEFEKTLTKIIDERVKIALAKAKP